MQQENVNSAGNNHSYDGIVTTMAEVESKELKWLWYPYIPQGKITLVYGKKGEDVRSCLLTLAAAGSRDKLGRTGTILYQDIGKDPAFIKEELSRLDADITRIGFINDQINDFSQLREIIDEAGITVLIIWPMEDFLLAKKKTRPAEIEAKMKRLSILANETGCTFIIGSNMLHPDKDVLSRNLAEPIRRYPRSVLEITETAEGFNIHQAKNNLAACGEDTIILASVPASIPGPENKEIIHDVNRTGIDQLSLERNINHVLKRAGMMTIEDVLALENRKALLRIRNIGVVSAGKILNALSSQGYDISKFQ